jgi:hypothetical protein
MRQPLVNHVVVCIDDVVRDGLSFVGAAVLLDEITELQVNLFMGA